MAQAFTRSVLYATVLLAPLAPLAYAAPSAQSNLDKVLSASARVSDVPSGISEVRAAALKQLGVGLGMRAGLADESRVIVGEIEKEKTTLDTKFNFGSLTFSNGALPPVIEEAQDVIAITEYSMRVQGRVYRIVTPATFGQNNWRNYLYLGLTDNDDQIVGDAHNRHRLHRRAGRDGFVDGVGGLVLIGLVVELADDELQRVVLGIEIGTETEQYHRNIGRPIARESDADRVEHFGRPRLCAVGVRTGTLTIGERGLYLGDDRVAQTLRLELHDGVDRVLSLAGIAKDAGIGLDDVRRQRIRIVRIGDARSLRSDVERAREKVAAEQQYRRELRRIEVANRQRRREHPHASYIEKRAKSDDE